MNPKFPPPPHEPAPTAPPFHADSAAQKIPAAEDSWISRNSGRVALALITLVHGAPPAAANKDSGTAAPFNHIIGTQAIGGRHHFTQEAPLLESAPLIAELGSGIIKSAISAQASFGVAIGNVIGHNPGFKILTDIASREPAHRAVLDMPFTHFLIWTYPLTTHGSAGQFRSAEQDHGVSWDL